MAFYAVKKGFHPGVYKTWEECSRETKGFSGAEFKKFPTEAEALAFVEGRTLEAPKSVAEDKAIAYVDGSYNPETGEYASGVVIFWKDEKITFSEKYSDPLLAQMRNVAGEIKAAEIAMQWCLDNDVPAVDIFHDYEGIAKWCTGEWKANREGTKHYRDYYLKTSEKVTITFHKVKGHSGDHNNEIADSLAKKALGIK